jgi:UDP-3-O-[3-hydroxymyristoyl] glucosamine N-acyltransferase
MNLAQLLSKIPLEFSYDFDPEQVTLNAISPLDSASSTDLSYFHDKKYLENLSETKASTLFISSEFVEYLPECSKAIITDEAELAFAYASKFYCDDITVTTSEYPTVDKTAQISPKAIVESGCKIDENVIIMAGAYIGANSHIATGTIIHPNVTIYHNTKIGKNCIFQAGSVIGADGYGYAHTKTGEHVRIYHSGFVQIDDSVEIGANVCIDRAVFKRTVIGKGSKIDNLVHIAHNVELGEHNLILGQTGIAGSTTFGRNVVMASQSGAVGHIHIADFTTIAARGGVTKDTESGVTYAGFPMMPIREWKKLQAKFARLLKGN